MRCISQLWNLTPAPTGYDTCITKQFYAVLIFAVELRCTHPLIARGPEYRSLRHMCVATLTKTPLAMTTYIRIVGHCVHGNAAVHRTAPSINSVGASTVRFRVRQSLITLCCQCADDAVEGWVFLPRSLYTDLPLCREHIFCRCVARNVNGRCKCDTVVLPKVSQW